MRACWNAYRKGHGRYEGEFYAIRQPVFSPGADDPWPAIPIYVAGVNPVMTAVAGEVADGFAAHTFCTPTYVERIIRPALARGADRVLLGSDYPVGEWKPIEFVRDTPGLSDADKDMIVGLNAARMLGVPVPA